MNVDQLKIELTPAFAKYRESIVAAYLFGSTARGEASSSSDLDIAVLRRTADKLDGVTLKFSLYADICRILHRNDIDLVLLNLSGNLILNDEIVRSGLVLYVSDDDARKDFELSLMHRALDFKFQRRYAMGV